MSHGFWISGEVMLIHSAGQATVDFKREHQEEEIYAS